MYDARLAFRPFAMPLMVSVFNRHLAGSFINESLNASTPASSTYETSNRVVYLPILVSVCTIRRVWWANGATTTGGATIEVGVYNDAGYKPGTKLVSGSATQGTASQLQFVDVTDTPLAPGRYWLAIVCSTNSSTTLLRVSADAAQEASIRMQEASTGLPATATPVESSSTQVWLFGFATTA